jgi:hypothetical protein
MAAAARAALVSFFVVNDLIGCAVCLQDYRLHNVMGEAEVFDLSASSPSVATSMIHKTLALSCPT